MRRVIQRLSLFLSICKSLGNNDSNYMKGFFTSYHEALGIDEMEFDTAACRACFMCGAGRPLSSELDNTSVLSVGLRNDGVGATAQEIVFAAAYAAKVNAIFGGLTSDHDTHFLLTLSHGADRRVILDFLFGDADRVIHEPRDPKSSLLDIRNYPGLVSKSSPEDALKYEDSFRHFLADINHNPASYFLNTVDVEPPHNAYSDFFTDQFLRELRLGASCGVSAVLDKFNMFRVIDERIDSFVPSESATVGEGDILEIQRLRQQLAMLEDAYEARTGHVPAPMMPANVNSLPNDEIEIKVPARKLAVRSRRADTITVVAHVRRGDVDENNKLKLQRYSDDTFYFNIFRAIEVFYVYE